MPVDHKGCKTLQDSSDPVTSVAVPPRSTAGLPYIYGMYAACLGKQKSLGFQGHEMGTCFILSRNYSPRKLSIAKKLHYLCMLWCADVSCMLFPALPISAFCPKSHVGEVLDLLKISLVSAYAKCLQDWSHHDVFLMRRHPKMEVYTPKSSIYREIFP